MTSLRLVLVVTLASCGSSKPVTHSYPTQPADARDRIRENATKESNCTKAKDLAGGGFSIQCAIDSHLYMVHFTDAAVTCEVPAAATPQQCDQLVARLTAAAAAPAPAPEGATPPTGE